MESAVPAAHKATGPKRQRRPRKKPAASSSSSATITTAAAIVPSQIMTAAPSNEDSQHVRHATSTTPSNHLLNGNGSPSKSNGLNSAAQEFKPNDRSRSQSPSNDSTKAASRSNNKPKRRLPRKPKQDSALADGEDANQEIAGASQQTQLTQQQQERECCVICADPITFYAIGECNHVGICSKCSMRMRMLMKDRQCPICKQALERVVVSSKPKPFESFQLWGDSGGADSILDEASEMIFVKCKHHFDQLRALREFKCRVKKCNEKLLSLAQLKNHLKNEHGTMFCELCLQHQNFFIQEYPSYTRASLRAHESGKAIDKHHKGAMKASTAESKEFHPMCRFCKKRFYSDMELFAHLERDHFKCHLCKTEHQYYRNYSDLEMHFRKQHHLCEDAGCLQNRFVVFANDVEYRSHMASVHGESGRLRLNFQIAHSARHFDESLPTGPGGSYRSSNGYHQDEDGFWNRDAELEQATANSLADAFPPLALSSSDSVSTSAPLVPAAVFNNLRVQHGQRQSQHQQRVSARRANTKSAANGQVARNQRFAEALGISRAGFGQGREAFEAELEQPNYPPELVEWGKANSGYLSTVERRLERVATERNCYNASLKPMEADERRMMHILAAIYNVASESMDEEPHRRVSFFKRENSCVPSVTLSKFIINERRAALAVARRAAASSSSTPSAQAGAPAAPGGAGVDRGWEHIVQRTPPPVPDAWSDDESEDEEQDCSSQGASVTEVAQSALQRVRLDEDEV